MNVEIFHRKINDDVFNFFIKDKFYIGTVQRCDKDTWVSQLLWDNGGDYIHYSNSKELAFKRIEQWITQ